MTDAPHPERPAPRRPTRRQAVGLIASLGIGLACGCGGNGAKTAARQGDRSDPAAGGSTPGDPEAAAPITNTDPCASRLHDISGGLLLYFAQHEDLPGELSALESIPGLEGAAHFACPVSDQPYVYRPGGIFLAERNASVVVYDPAPSHSGMRWAVTVADPQPGEPLVTKVIALPERFFLLHPPG